ncbi:MAG TPA: hypothetical protein VJH05_02420 [Candidatus Paceibacterota bacterium]
MKKFIFRTTILVFSILTHFALGEFWALPEWYGYFEHFFIGGVMTAWTAIAFWEWLENGSRFTLFLKIIGSCSILGIAWEVFEYWGFQRYATQPNYYADTIWDFQMNFFGALTYLALRELSRDY